MEVDLAVEVMEAMEDTEDMAVRVAVLVADTDLVLDSEDKTAVKGYQKEKQNKIYKHIMQTYTIVFINEGN